MGVLTVMPGSGLFRDAAIVSEIDCKIDKLVSAFLTNTEYEQTATFPPFDERFRFNDKH